MIRLIPFRIKNGIKNYIFGFKKKHSFLVKRYNGTFTTKDLINQIEMELDSDDQVLMVHTSMNNLMPMFQGSASELIDSLIELTNKRNMTLVFPGFTLGKKNINVGDYYKNKKEFNVQRTPTTVGLINELFRRKRGVYRSIHPTHSILALGEKAREITDGHQNCETTFGKNTPFDRMDRLNTRIIGIGVYYFRNLTHVHVAEDLLNNRFPFPFERSYDVIPVDLVDKKTTTVYSLKLFTDTLSKKRDLTILKKYMSKNDLHQWNYKGVPMFMANAKQVTKTLIELAEIGITIYKKKR